MARYNIRLSSKAIERDSGTSWRSSCRLVASADGKIRCTTGGRDAEVHRSRGRREEVPMACRSAGYF